MLPVIYKAPKYEPASAPAPGHYPRTTQPSSTGRRGGKAEAEWLRSDASMLLSTRKQACQCTQGQFGVVAGDRTPGPSFVPWRNSRKGKGLLCTKAKAAETQVQLPAGDTLGDSGEFIAAGLHFRRVK